ncbi:esterase-like activity of phytase family protein [Mixta hanseatica]|uniref:Esterase-like activity of phytase family protein n=1 Tax=Mixta hanseatica TaxID=2872648 RepID=A0ABY4RDI7_9GAMM|nr:esterase-like activity of phytase family protein [Mixta hanseatica]UQY45097.1 esterase-like activity of phytase family protein [Mixta hanseatica]
MKSKSLALCVSLFPLYASAVQPQIERYVVAFPQGDRVALRRASVSEFPNGLPVGVGSGLHFLRKEGGDLLFATLTDRGPNADAPKTGKRESKIFVSPNYTPLLMTIRVGSGKANAIDAHPLHDEQGNISGLPLPEGFIGATNEAALNESLQLLGSDKRGLDTEGITSDGNGGYWICDEYGPFIAHISADGKILQKYGPQAEAGEQGIAGGLPNIVKWRQPNRGFEGLTRMPDGRIIAAVQSTLDIDGKSKNSARFTRLVSFDPATGKTASYGYPIDIDAYKKAKDAKVGDIVALDNQRLLLIEQGADKDKNMRNRIYLVDLSQASDLTPLDKQPPELNDEAALKSRGVVLASKQLVVDLRALGWHQEKVEGLALIDNKTLAVINDNDFGIRAELTDAVSGKDKMDDYTTDGKGHLLVNGEAVKTKIAVRPLDKPENENELWIISLPEAL